MDETLTHWQTVVTQAAVELRQIGSEQARWRPAEGKWSAAEIVGHLIDSAINNYYRFVEAQLRAELVFTGYNQDAWVRVQAYQTADWSALVQLWIALNQRLIAMVAAMPLEALSQPRSVHNLDELAWQPVHRDEATTLRYFIVDYVGHLEHHLAQLLRQSSAAAIL